MPHLRNSVRIKALVSLHPTKIQARKPTSIKQTIWPICSVYPNLQSTLPPWILNVLAQQANFYGGFRVFELRTN